MARAYLTSDTTLYFDGQSGNDANDGQSVATAFRTVQRAWDWAADNLDLGGRGLIFQSTAPATFSYANAGLATCKGMIGQGRVRDVKIDGGGSTWNRSDNMNSFMGGDVTTGEPAETVKFQLQNMKLRATAGGGINMNGSKCVVWETVDFGPMTAAQMSATNPAAAVVADGSPLPVGADGIPRKNGYTISGGAAIHAQGLCGGFVIIHAMRISITQAAAYSYAFLVGTYPAGGFYSEFTQYVNPTLVTGREFVVDIGGYGCTIGINALPGNQLGSVGGVRRDQLTVGSWQDQMWQR